MGRKTAEIAWRNGMVASRDGTAISFLSTGRGPGLVVIPGNNRRAHHYEALARELSGTFTVHVIDRRGRGLSGPQGPGYRIDDEVDDALAVMDHTGTELLFGHSYGGLAALRLALRRRVARLVAYEPGVSVHGSFDGSWLPEFTALLAQGRKGAAMATFLKRTGLSPIGDAPMPVFRVLAFLLLHGSDGAETRAMMPTTPAEMGEIVRLDGDGREYARITSPVLLLGGSKSPAYLTTPLLADLARGMPDARHLIMEGLDHNAPDLNAPAVVAGQITAFAHW
ncbi:alpha/beta fold hydrolase [Sphaerisporangium corydalis]|uniref:Alpha/beta fold hydrolase n=1 Tax=Sphaerisporangium corydalis TaxID=1441875 RepID=A0ABV9EEJ0_9ACTN|nr:alpha/beta hydrolase [Sphaerisporangium corydalis]